jgi:hypothetical protein
MLINAACGVNDLNAVQAAVKPQEGKPPNKFGG